MFQKNCTHSVTKYESAIGVEFVVPEWEAAITAVVLTLIIIVTLIGNILVILSILTHKPLNVPQNYFLLSLAVADLTVAVFVLPLNIVDQLLGYWKFGSYLCKMWLTCDILCCTASILHLCIISLDRYWAITDPLNYAQKRTGKFAFFMICGVWIFSVIISSPPLAGWNTWPAEFDERTKCELNLDHGYRIYSSLGSFYIPLFVMSIVYFEIYIATRKRLKERERASQLCFTRLSQRRKYPAERQQIESLSSENQQDEGNDGEADETKTIGQRMRSWVSWKRSSSKDAPSEESLTDTDVEENPGGTNSNPTGNIVKSPTRSKSLKSPKSRRPSQKDLMSPTSILSMVLPSPVPKRKQPADRQIDAKKKISLSKERRAARTLGIIMGVFVVCWLPYFVIYVIDAFVDSFCPSIKLINFITWLGYVNSSLNPIIYTIFNMDFRKAFKKLLRLT